MIPSKVENQGPRLPVIKDPDEGSDDDKIGFESDEDIEILIRKTQFLRHSKSAHADLAPPVKKKAVQLNGYGIQVRFRILEEYSFCLFNVCSVT